MGHPKFSRRKFGTPTHPWTTARITEETALRAQYGLKNMREIWKARSQLRRHRQQAMKLIGRVDSTSGHYLREKEELIVSLHRRGLIAEGATLDDVLTMTTEDMLNRRLQSQVFYKGLAATMKQARQLASHGHIAIGDQKVTVPSYVVARNEEALIHYYETSDLTFESHPLREEIAGIRAQAEYEDTEHPGPEFTDSDVEQIKASAQAAPSAAEPAPADTSNGGEA